MSNLHETICASQNDKVDSYFSYHTGPCQEVMSYAAVKVLKENITFLDTLIWANFFFFFFSLQMFCLKLPETNQHHPCAPLFCQLATQKTEYNTNISKKGMNM